MYISHVMYLYIYVYILLYILYMCIFLILKYFSVLQIVHKIIIPFKKTFHSISLEMRIS